MLKSQMAGVSENVRLRRIMKKSAYIFIFNKQILTMENKKLEINPLFNSKVMGRKRFLFRFFIFKFSGLRNAKNSRSLKNSRSVPVPVPPSKKWNVFSRSRSRYRSNPW
jgi:hypothetical protein